MMMRVTQETIDERITQFRERIKLDGFLPACGSCGIRHCFVDEDDLGNPTRKHDKTRSRPSRIRRRLYASASTIRWLRCCG